MTPLVLFHGGCSDGFCSAWITNRVIPDAEFIPVQYGELPPDVTDRVVYILDFSYKRDVLLQMIKDSKELTLLDHHKTAQHELQYIKSTAGHPTIIFDMNKSDAKLTWEYFFPKQPAPWIVDYVQDRDLWKWKLPSSREINAALNSYPMAFDVWTGLLARKDELIKEGAIILRYENKLIDKLCDSAMEITLDEQEVLAVNTPCLISEVAGRLAEDRPFGVAWFQRSDGKFVYSLRSTNEDVSEIAKKFGGGGHRNSSAFSLDKGPS